MKNVMIFSSLNKSGKSVTALTDSSKFCFNKKNRMNRVIR